MKEVQQNNDKTPSCEINLNVYNINTSGNNAINTS